MISRSDVSVAELLVAALSHSDPTETVAAALEHARQVDEPERVKLFEAVVDMLRDAGTLYQGDDEPLPPAGLFFGADHRWEGWREDDPVPLPIDPKPSRDEVVAALRRLPLAMRAIIVLRDGAGISTDDCAGIVSGTTAEQVRLLDQARAAFVSVLSVQVGRRQT